MDSPEARHRRVRALLLAGMLGGMAAAAWTLAGGESALPDGAVARVNDRLITREAWLRAVTTVASERRTPLTGADHRRILERLIDEELLVQRGVALGLVEHDRRLRGQLVAEVIAAATAATAEPDEAALRAFYDAHLDYFSTPGRLRVSATRAGGAPFTPPIPNDLLPPAKLREYVGPHLTQVALGLAPGQSSAPADDVILRILEKEPGRTPAFEDIRREVREEVRRRGDEAALRRLLEELRADGDVVVPAAPE